MTTRTREPSFEKLNYLLRPSKQVERKLFIETLHCLAAGGLKVSEYTYVGFGSVYYADFILFHKYLYVDEMICVEAQPIPKRMRFNKPFDFIRLKMERFSYVLPSLKRDKRYIVWLDYDYGLNEEILRDVAGCLYVLAPGSILIVTIDAEPLPHDVDYDEQLTGEQRMRILVKDFRARFGRYYRNEITRSLFSGNAFPKLLAEILRSHFSEEITKRRGLKFVQLFNFRYADTAQMLSVGGVIADTQVQAQIRQSGVSRLDFVNRTANPLVISVPPLTVREKQWLDKRFQKGKRLSSLAFELEPKMVQNFRKYYRHYPTYYETLT